MTQLAILSDADRQRFDRPRELTKESRRRVFHVSGDVRLALARIKQPTNKVGFLLQLSYFKAGARFYSPLASKRRDIEYVQRVLKIESSDLTRYSGTVIRRHRLLIRNLLNWQIVDDVARDGLMAEAHRYVANQEHPKEIFQGLMDLCWKHRWAIPSYHDLADIITRCSNEADGTLMRAVERVLTPEHVERLEVLLIPIERSPAARSAAPITALKTIDQSLRPGKIGPSMETLALYRDHFMSLRIAMDALPLSDKATEYYANWLRIANQQQITQFTNRHKTRLHLLAFIKHQFFQRQDAAINVLLKSVTATRTAVRSQLRQ